MRQFHNIRRSRIKPEDLVEEAPMPDRKRRRLPAADDKAISKASALERGARASRSRRLLEEVLRREQGREWHEQGQEWA